MKPTIKNLIIDFGSVLIDLDRPRCIAAFERLGFTQMEALIDPCHQQGILKMLEKGEISTAMFRDEVRKAAGGNLQDREIDAAWNSFLIGIPGYKLELLLKLRKKYNLYLLSNTNEIHWDWACRNSFSYKGLQAEDYFDELFLSYRMGQLKPGEEIFRTLLEQTGADPGESFFIDDAEANCRTAQQLGIETYQPAPLEDWSPLFD